MSDLFITGITGLVGRALAAELGTRGRGATVLVRDPDSAPAGLEAVAGDLVHPAGWSGALEGAGTVVHAAAVTGAAPPEVFDRVNVAGTRALLEAAEAAGVERFVFVSSIAAGFADLERYPYGASKRDAEALVRASGLDWVIVRPTVVIGPGSPILGRFSHLAGLPISVLPGPGTSRIQPIGARDLARAILDVVDEPGLDGETIEIGGPRVVTTEEFLRLVRVARGRRPGPVVRLPLGAVRLGLRIAAALTAGRFPLRPAQLAMFEQDGVAAPHPFVAARRHQFLDLAGMLQWSFAETGGAPARRLPTS